VSEKTRRAAAPQAKLEEPEWNLRSTTYAVSLNQSAKNSTETLLHDP
jgi:hypothetical protein